MPNEGLVRIIQNQEQEISFLKEELARVREDLRETLVRLEEANAQIRALARGIYQQGIGYEGNRPRGAQ